MFDYLPGRSGLSKHAFLLLVAFHAEAVDGVCSLPRPLLAKLAGIGRATFISALRELEGAGLVEVRYVSGKISEYVLT